MMEEEENQKEIAKNAANSSIVQNDSNEEDLFLDGAVPPLNNVKFHVMPKSVNDEHFIHLFPAYGGKALVRTEPGDFVIGCQYEAHADKIYRCKLREDDTWIVTFPKSGTTWMQELVWLLLNNCDTKAARRTKLECRVPFIEWPYMYTDLKDVKLDYFFTPKKLAAMKSPRAIKSHLPFFLLPPKLIDTCKVVYVARNPKDVIVSFYHHHRLFQEFHGFNGDLEEFVQFFIDDEIFTSPYFPHILDAWSRRNHPNFLFVFYEDLKKNLSGEIMKIADFLKTPVTDEQLTSLVEHLTFDNFKNNESIFVPTENGHFVRKGMVGDWKNHFSVELNQKLDIWIEKNLAGTDLKFVTEMECRD